MPMDLQKPPGMPFSAWEPLSDQEKAKAQIAAQFQAQPSPPPDLVPIESAAVAVPPAKTVDPYKNANDFFRKRRQN